MLGPLRTARGAGRVFAVGRFDDEPRLALLVRVVEGFLPVLRDRVLEPLRPVVRDPDEDVRGEAVRGLARQPLEVVNAQVLVALALRVPEDGQFHRVQVAVGRDANLHGAGNRLARHVGCDGL